MDEARTRAIIREEIALAVQTLGEVAERDEDSSFDRTASDFRLYAHRGACEAADEQRARQAENPFEDRPAVWPDATVKDLVHAELQNVLREMRDAFYLSGSSDDYRVAERLDGLIAALEPHADNHE